MTINNELCNKGIKKESPAPYTVSNNILYGRKYILKQDLCYNVLNSHLLTPKIYFVL